MTLSQTNCQDRKKEIPVSIMLTSEQSNLSEGAEKINLQGAGTLKRDDCASCWTVSYDETEATGMQGTKTYLSLFDDQSVKLLREGKVSMEVFFRKGGRFISSLDTGYGVFDLNIITNEAGGKLSESGGEIFLSYAMGLAQRDLVSTKVNVQIEARSEVDKLTN